MRSFCARRSRKLKKTDNLTVFARAKAAHKMLMQLTPGVSERPNFEDFKDAAAEATTSVPDFKTGESAGGLGKRMESQGPPTPPPSSSSPSQFSAL